MATNPMLTDFTGRRRAEAEDLSTMFGSLVRPLVAPAVAAGTAANAANAAEAAPAAPMGATPQPAMLPQPASTPAMPSSTMPAAVREGIMAGESGGDFDALFGYSNRPGGAFEGVRVSQMTLDELDEFADPRGPYARWVKENNPKGETATPMGAFQVVGTTFRDAVKALGLPGDTVFTPEVQQQVADWILETQGTEAWEGYRGPSTGRGAAPTGATASAKNAPFEAVFPEEEQAPARGPIDALKAFFAGEDAPELDFKSGLESLGIGLGQMSRGQTVDTSEVRARQERRNMIASAEYKERAQRRAAAQYAYETGNTDAARAIMSGGMSLDTMLQENDRQFLRERMLDQDAKTEEGRRAIQDWIVERGGTPAEAAAAAENPTAYFSAEAADALLEDRMYARENTENTVAALGTYYEQQGDPASMEKARLVKTGGLDALKAVVDVNQIEQDAALARESLDFQRTQGERGFQLDLANFTRELGLDKRAEATDARDFAARVQQQQFENTTSLRALGQQDRALDQTDTAMSVDLARDQRLAEREQAALDLDNSARNGVAAVAERNGAAPDVVEALRSGADLATLQSLGAPAELAAKVQEEWDTRRATAQGLMESVGKSDARIAKAVTLYSADLNLSLSDAIDIVDGKAPSADLQLYERFKQENPDTEVGLLEFIGVVGEAKAAKTTISTNSATTLTDEIDKKVAPVVVEHWSGGRANLKNNKALLDAAITALEGGRVDTNALTGILPEPLLAMFLPETLDAQNAVQGVLQQSLRDILGAQFTALEGQQLIARGYNPLLSDKYNLPRVERLRDLVAETLRVRDEMSAYANENGTMRGYVGGYTDTATFVERANAILDAEDAAAIADGVDPALVAPTGATDTSLDALDAEIERLERERRELDGE